MSDFGTMALVRRKDGQSVGDADRQALDAAIAQTQAAGPFADALSEPFAFRVVGSVHEGSQGFAVVLSEYWLEMADAEGVNPDDLLAQNEPVADQARHALQNALGGAYLVEPNSGHW